MADKILTNALLQVPWNRNSCTRSRGRRWWRRSVGRRFSWSHHEFQTRSSEMSPVLPDWSRCTDHPSRLFSSRQTERIQTLLMWRDHVTRRCAVLTQSIDRSTYKLYSASYVARTKEPDNVKIMSFCICTQLTVVDCIWLLVSFENLYSPHMVEKFNKHSKL